MYKREGHGKPHHTKLPGVKPAATAVDARVAKLEQIPELVMKLAQELQRYKKETALEIAQLKERFAAPSSAANSTGSEVLVDLHEGDLPDIQKAISALTSEVSPQPNDIDTSPQVDNETVVVVADVQNETAKEEDSTFKSPFAVVDKKKKKKKKKDDKAKRRDSESDAD